MKTLTIHPSDKTTDVLKPIYNAIDTDVYNGSDYTVLRKTILQYERFIIMGHGTPYGLLNWRKDYVFGIQKEITDIFRKNDTNIYIWCNANRYVESNDLKGFATGMIISEPMEAEWFNIEYTPEMIEESNILFANSIRDNLNDDIPKMVYGVRNQYSSETNPIIKFNMKNIHGYI